MSQVLPYSVRRRARETLLFLFVFLWKTFLVALVAAVVLGAAYSIYYMEHNDYAGLDQKQVLPRTAQLARDWYGLNDRPAYLSVYSKTKSTIYGSPAWKVVYRTPRETYICIYTWDTSSDTAEDHAIFTGDICLT